MASKGGGGCVRLGLVFLLVMGVMAVCGMCVWLGYGVIISLDPAIKERVLQAGALVLILLATAIVNSGGRG